MSNNIITNTQQKAERGTLRYRLIRNCILLSGLSVFAQLYLFQPMLDELCADFGVSPAESSLSVSMSTIGMALGLFFFTFKADDFSRIRLMSFSMILSSILTISTAIFYSFPMILFLSFAKGLVLSGVSAVALAYITEEVSLSIIGLAISLYLSGNTIGGMSGRVIATLVSGWFNWQIATLTIGFMSLFMGIVFAKYIPSENHFTPVRVKFITKLGRMKFLLRQMSFVSLYVVAFLVMGAFVSVYNYLSFILKSPPFSLPHYIVAMIFVMYTTGVVGSIVMGSLSDKYSPILLLRCNIILMMISGLLLLVMNIWSIVVGLGLFTFAFFSTHTMASRIVSINAGPFKSSANCLYWLFYYIGSSVAGYITGIILANYGWNVFVWSISLMSLMAFLISFLRSSVSHIPPILQG